MDLTRRRMANERLLGAPFATPEEAVRWLCAVQCQDYPAAKWGLGLRCASITDADLDSAFDAGRILRTHVLRPTWHFVMPEDLRSLLAVTSARVHKANAGYYRKVGVEARAFTRAMRVFEKLLEGGRFATREAMAQGLEREKLPSTGMGLAYLVMNAELEGLICSGPREGKSFTYALLEERVPKVKSKPLEQARSELVRRFFQSHGPATVRDCAWWSGLTGSDVKAGLAESGDALESFAQDGLTWWFDPSLPEPRASRTAAVHLLPIYDEYLVAFQDRGVAFAPGDFERLDPMRDVMARNLLLVDGRVAGGWRRELKAQRVELEVAPFRRLRPAEREALDAAASAYGAFLAREVELTVRGPAR